MCSRMLVVAAALLLAPLGARAADLVVWWEKGFYPDEDAAVAEIIAAFEQETGNEVELVQPTQHDLPAKARAAIEADSPGTSSSALMSPSIWQSGPSTIGL